MRQKTANDARRAGVLVLVALLHLGLLWLLINSTSSYQIVRNVSTLVRLIEPEPVKRKLGATLKSPVITPSIFILPKVEPPKVVVMIVKPTPQAPPAPAAPVLPASVTPPRQPPYRRTTSAPTSSSSTTGCRPRSTTSPRAGSASCRGR